MKNLIFVIFLAVLAVTAYKAFTIDTEALESVAVALETYSEFYQESCVPRDLTTIECARMWEAMH